jgi:hypothetical protein
MSLFEELTEGVVEILAAAVGFPGKLADALRLSGLADWHQLLLRIVLFKSYPETFAVQLQAVKIFSGIPFSCSYLIHARALTL